MCNTRMKLGAPSIGLFDEHAADHRPEDDRDAGFKEKVDRSKAGKDWKGVFGGTYRQSTAGRKG